MPTMPSMAPNSEEKHMERVYKTMRGAGACSIAVGIVVIVTGVVAGSLAIIAGSVLLKRKSEITF